MRFRNIFSALTFSVLFCCLSIIAAAQAKTENKPTQTGSIRGETYTYKYSNLDFADTPSWNPETDELPLTAKQAVGKARENLPRYVQNTESFKVASVLLRSLNNDKWFYNISFVCRGATCRDLPARQFTMVVKLDGTLLEPKIISLD